MSLLWRVAPDGGLAIYRHEYQQKVANGRYGEWTEIPHSAAGGGANAGSFTLTGLTNGALYTFKIRAVNPEGEGAESPEASGTPAGTPSAPRSLSAAVTTLGGQSLTLTWSLGSSDGGAPLTHHDYKIKEGSAGSYGDWITIADSAPAGAHDTSFEIAGLTRDESYYFRVRSVNSEGGSLSSNEATVLLLAPPGSPRLENVRVRGANTIELRWSSPSNSSRSQITSYRVEASSDGGGTTLCWRKWTLRRGDIPTEISLTRRPGTTAFLR